MQPPEVLTDAAIAQIGIVIAALALYPEPGKEPPAVADLFPKQMVRTAAAAAGRGGGLTDELAKGVLDTYSSVSNIIFAYQGQSMMFELMAEMRDPSTFGKGLAAANGIYTSVYVSVSVVCFYLAGRDVKPFLLDSVPSGPLRIIAALLLGFHILIAYVLCGQPLHIVLHEWVSPATAHDTTGVGQLKHTAITFTVLVLAFLVSNLIPFFEDLQGIIGSFCAAPIIFFFP